MLLDYETLKLIWWGLIGLLLIGFAITDGFDMGVGALLPFLGRNDMERRVIINSVGPHWDGNQVWFITAGGAIFAAWPMVYAVAFSGFYIAMLLVLFALFFRPVGFDYRSKVGDPRWRNAWDWGLFIGGSVPALLFGVAFGNLILGVPFQYDEFLRPTYTGSFLSLLRPFALLVGVVSLSMLVMHGAVWLQLRTTHPIATRARQIVTVASLVMMIAFALAGIWIAWGVEGYRIVAMPDHGSLPNPMAKTVTSAVGAWLDNYGRYPWMTMAPILGFVGGALTILLSMRNRPGLAFITSGIGMTGIILTAGFSMFPFIMPSSSVPNSSLTLWDASSSHYTLMLMFWTAMLLVPVILAYTIWAYWIMWGKWTVEYIHDHDHQTY